MQKNEKAIYDEVCGHFLLARLNVKGVFSRSVVWVYEFSKKTGARGLVVNRPMERSLARCAPSFAGTALGDVPIFIGGPVETGALLFMTRSRTVFDGNCVVRVGASLEDLRRMIFNPNVRVYGFAGRAEWMPGQLEKEIIRQTWICAQMDASIWDEGGGESFWRRLLVKTNRPDADLMLSAPKDPSEN